MFYRYYYNFEIFHKYLHLSPVYITTLKRPPDNWGNVTIDKLVMKLPLSEYTDVSGENGWIKFSSDKGFACYISFSTKEDRNEFSSYKHRLRVLKSTPEDISFFNLRKKNMTAAELLIGKTLSVPAVGLNKIIAVQRGGLSALCELSEKCDSGFYHGYLGDATLFNPDGTPSITLVLANYKNAISLEADLLSILGGVKTPYHENNMNRVREDINNLVKQFNET